MLSDALSEQYAQHGNWRFLRNNDRFIFQILRSLEHDTGDDRRPRHAAARLAHQFWVIDQGACWLARARRAAGRHPAGIMVNGVGRLGYRLAGGAPDAQYRYQL
jgi:hypothetical protein